MDPFQLQEENRRPRRELARLKEENRRPRRELARLKEENEILLKASAFFASKQL